MTGIQKEYTGLKRENLKKHGLLRKRLCRILPYKIKMRRMFDPKYAGDRDVLNEIHGFRADPNRETYAQGITDPRPKGVFCGWYPHIFIEGAWHPVFITDSINRNEWSAPPAIPKYLYYFKKSRKKYNRLSIEFIEIDKYLLKKGGEKNVK